MKTLNRFIVERLKINKDTKIIGDIPIKFSDDITFTQEEINIVQKYAQKLKVKPVIITNYVYFINERRIGSRKNTIFMYFNDDWETKMVKQIYFCKAYDEWIGYISLDIMGKKISQNQNIEDTCEELIKYLDENPDFYNKIRKIKK